MTTQMTAQKVLLLRSPETSGPDRYAEILQRQGYDVYNVPTLSFQYQDLEQLQQEMDSACSFSGIVFTSPRAVMATSVATGRQLNDAWYSKPCFVVGERTDALAKELGLSPVGSESGNAANLADIIIEKMSGNNLPLLFPCGNLKMETLPTKLKNANILLHSCTVYVTCQHPEFTVKLQECMDQKPNFVVYFSPSGVTYSQEMMKQKAYICQVKHIPIGHTTRDALEKNGIEVHAIPAKPTPEDLLDVLKKECGECIMNEGNHFDEEPESNIL